MNCIWCGKEIIVKGKKEYCSQKCYQAHFRKNKNDSSVLVLKRKIRQMKQELGVVKNNIDVIQMELLITEKMITGK